MVEHKTRICSHKTMKKLEGGWYVVGRHPPAGCGGPAKQPPA